MITRIIDWLTPPQKVGQIIQADIASVTPDDVAAYHLGAVLNGGNSAPKGNQRASHIDWLDLADAYWTASMRADGPRIPVLWGTDAVHGHNNLVGATIFPHNIGLGATRDADLVERIGAATAREVRATGMDWTFAPTVAVACDGRWGRTYEAYGESPKLVADLGAALVRGLQGLPGERTFLGSDKIIATAKHFIGDGGTRAGKDQGETVATEAEMRDTHAAGYYSTLDAGAQTIMASFSSWGGRKMHGHQAFLTDLLKTHWGFDGVVVGDWDGHGQIAGAIPTDCPDALMAGLDMYMAPDSWKGLHASLLRHLESGRISGERLDDAVRRVLRLKFRAGLCSQPMPSARPHSATTGVIGCKAHTGLAVEAVRKSAVLLKNANHTLPLKSPQHILVTGQAADDLSMQCGGWSLSWQGGILDIQDYPHAETLLSGVRRIAAKRGSTVSFARDGHFRKKPDIAIHVFGEAPYAEFRGDLSTLDFHLANDADTETLKRLQGVGIPVVCIFLSGRPLWVNSVLNASDAFVAAFLPGTQAGALADLLFGTDGKSDLDFTGKLPFSWPEYADQHHLNVGSFPYAPLFPYGFGLSLKDSGNLRVLHENRVLPQPDHSTIFEHGMTGGGWSIRLDDAAKSTCWQGDTERSSSGAVELKAADLGQQENAIQISWTRARSAPVIFSHDALDLTRETNAGFCFTLTITKHAGTAKEPVLSIHSGSGRTEIGGLCRLVSHACTDTTLTFEIPLRALAEAGVDMSHFEGVELSARAPTRLILSRLALVMPNG
ncbi:glycoside hydrolase family 3 N-terminal domain-containing protein [Hyphomonas sp.]|jgi:beta-glucosidase|uniref:glycoside hydrolase family 3 protein n=1 Tax=Hyphomonas sp. TaxID=87 RepID=UPI0032D93C40